MPGPNWLNAWVRVNAKHVTSPESSGGSSEPSKNGPDAKAADGSDPSTSTAPTTDTTPREESVSVTSSARVTRKGRRRLQKTRSASDLLREMAVRDVGSPSANKYLNEAAFILQLEQRKQLDSPDSKAYLRARYSPAVSPPPPPPPLPARATTAPQGGGLKLFPPSFLMGDNNSSNDKSECSRCKALEEQLRVAETDVEYLRVTALQNEYQCASCQQAKKASPPWSAPQALTPSEGSKQLVAVTHRHKKQIEQLTRERSRWQQDMHFKLHKFANLCKDLNEESAIRNVRAIALEQELETVKSERDQLSADVQTLRAQLQELENKQADYDEMKRKLSEYEQNGLCEANEAIQSRDRTILQLSSKLDSALSQLEIERAQRQRRQVIFPAQLPAQNKPDSPPHRYNTSS